MKTIVWDVDDVLNNLMKDWFENHWLPGHPGTAISYEEITENPPHRLLGISVNEYLNSLDEFRLSESGRNLEPVKEVVQWFKEHGRNFRHVALTATPLKAAPLSSFWVMSHFGTWIRSYNIVPSAREEQGNPLYDQGKDEFLRWWNKGDILVDDNPSVVGMIEESEMKVVLMPRPWNKSALTTKEALDLLTSYTSQSGAMYS
jgi:hypothetical protein